MPIFTTAGTKLFIGGPLAAKNTDFVAADFTSQTWVEINPLESIGSIGDTSQEVTFDGVSYARTQKLKGTRNAGNMECVAGLDYADLGQVALLAAEKTPHDYAFKIVFDDAPATGSDPEPSQRLFVAKVMSASEQYDGANNVKKLNFSLGVNSNVVRVNATTGD